MALALAGLFDANGVWRDHVQAPIRANVSPAVFAVIRDAVSNVVDPTPCAGGPSVTQSTPPRRDHNL